jgi:hypothetical protein
MCTLDDARGTHERELSCAKAWLFVTGRTSAAVTTGRSRIHPPEMCLAAAMHPTLMRSHAVRQRSVV